MASAASSRPIRGRIARPDMRLRLRAPARLKDDTGRRMLFDTNKCFLLPTALGALGKIRKVVQ